MGFEPQKFFVGLMDFFSILLPGGLVTYLIKDSIGPMLIGNAYFRIGGAEGWIVFLFSAYLLGHFIFLLGSGLLDDVLYDRVRNATHAQQIRRLAEGKRPASRLSRWLAPRLVKAVNDHAVSAAARIKKHYLAPLSANNAINAFQWSKARLVMDRSEALSIVQRFEADSKFFRSLCIVIAFLIIWGVATGRPGVAAASVGFLVLSLWRYTDQRAKASMQAYWYVITAEGARPDGFRISHSDSAGLMTHAGGVVFRRDNGTPRFLLVRANDANVQWVLPKGHVEAGESWAVAAVREVREEAGVLARVVKPLSPVSYTLEGKRVDIQFYLMEAHVHHLRTQENRPLRWLSLDDAVKEASHDDTKDLLRQGGELLRMATPEGGSPARVRESALG